MIFYLTVLFYYHGTATSVDYTKTQCNNMKVATMDAVYMDGNVVPTPEWIFPVYACDLIGPINITYTFAAPSLGLGKWTLFYGGTSVLKMQLESSIFESVPGLNGLSISTRPLNITYRVDTSTTVYLPSFYVSVVVNSTPVNTSAIIGTIVLTVVFLAIIAGMRVVLY